MYKEPWLDINEYGESHGKALQRELFKELSKDHYLHVIELQVLAKREDQDDILLTDQSAFYIVHLTWSGKKEEAPYPRTEKFSTMEELQARLDSDSEDF
ncbi:hypothetical protein [Microbulbifer sp. PSTR4-B]|uniref:hypothetical protein n=1 Tax=Microbulbifer sp. PSTR4-B TaxID=3243396 RepID=UPI00403A67B3